MDSSKMLYNRITLSFPEKDEGLFKKQYFSDSIRPFRISYIAVISLYGIFGFLDLISVPEHTELFFTIRFLFVIPILLAVFLLSFTEFFYKIWEELLVFSFVVGGTGISIMVILMPDNFTYYGGLMLVFSAGYFFVKLRFFLASLAGWATLIIFNLGAIFFGSVPSEFLINTNFFFISANLIGMFASYNIEYYTRRDFFLNRQLDKEKLITQEINKGLERTVEERTRELLLAKETAESNSANVTAIIEGTKHNIWAFNRNYEILYINHVFQREFQQMFGGWLEKGVGLFETLPKALIPIWKARYDRVLRNEHFTIEDPVDTDNGIIYIRTTFNPIVNKGQVIGGSCFSSIITDSKLAELELIKAKEKAEESDRLKTAFLQNMSHEIRTPMNAIMGFSSLLVENYGDRAKLEQFAEIINQRANDLLDIINDILDISKIESGQLSVNNVECNIKELFTELNLFFIEYQKRLRKEHINFSLVCDPGQFSPLIQTDTVKLKQILINLIGNAFKFTDKGSVECSCRFESDFLQFYVSDTGVGIPTNRFDNIFERFTQLENSVSGNIGGTGLGLSIAKGLTNLLGGKIWIESEVNKGTTFHFTIKHDKSLIE